MPMRRRRYVTLQTIEVPGYPPMSIYLGPLDGLMEDAAEERAAEFKARYIDGKWINPEDNTMMYERLDLVLPDGTFVNGLKADGTCELSYQSCRVACAIEAMQDGAPPECFYPAEDLLRYAKVAKELYEALKQATNKYRVDPNKGWEGKALPVSVAQSHDSV